MTHTHLRLVLASFLLGSICSASFGQEVSGGSFAPAPIPSDPYYGGAGVPAGAESGAVIVSGEGVVISGERVVGESYPGAIYSGEVYGGQNRAGQTSWPIVGERVISRDGVPVVEGQIIHESVDGVARPAGGSAAAVSDESPGCQPKFVDQQEFTLETERAFLLTHFSRRLDTHFVTKPGLETLVSFAKQLDNPLLYLHEPHTPNGDYFYPSCDPQAYIQSSIGHFDFQSVGLEHAIVAGGFYEMCLNNTVSQLIENWQERAEKRELKITYVTDAIYCVAEDRRFADSFEAAISNFILQQPSPVVLMSDVLDQVPARDDAWAFLARRWQKVPMDWGLYVRFRGEYTAVRFANDSQPTLTIEYLTTSELETRLRPDGDQASVPDRSEANHLLSR